MILAHHGIEFLEADLVRAAAMEEGGVDIEELARLAERLGLRSEIRQLTLDEIAELLTHDQWVVVYFNRLPLDRVFSVHAVIPVRFTSRFVTVLDPRLGQRRISRRKLDAARRYLAYYGVICGPTIEVS